jgi:hypothetical protein
MSNKTDLISDAIYSALDLSIQDAFIVKHILQGGDSEINEDIETALTSINAAIEAYKSLINRFIALEAEIADISEFKSHAEKEEIQREVSERMKNSLMRMSHIEEIEDKNE